MPVPPEPCDTCRHRCPCNPEKGEFCAHYGCPGRPIDQPATCPGAIVEICRYERQRAAEQSHARILRARRVDNSHAYARNVAREADRARAEVSRAVQEARPPVTG